MASDEQAGRTRAAGGEGVARSERNAPGSRPDMEIETTLDTAETSAGSAPEGTGAGTSVSSGPLGGDPITGGGTTTGLGGIGNTTGGGGLGSDPAGGTVPPGAPGHGQVPASRRDST